MEKSQALSTAKVQKSETGMAQTGTSVARRSCKKRKQTITTSTKVSTRVETISLIESRTTSVAS